ncbi:MAG: TIGR00725 family protein [Salinarimonas sp.]
MTELTIDPQGRIISGGSVFDPRQLAWRPASPSTDARDSSGLRTIDARDALRHLHETAPMRRLPVGVIGPREATPRQCAIAETLGRELANLGLTMLCGGKSGVMEAVCRGHAEAGGLPIGLLPDDDWRAANDYVAIPIATGIGNARNAIIARACFAMVAVGGGYGTLSEIAFGLHYGRLVLILDAAPEVEGAIRCADIDDALDRLAARVFSRDTVAMPPA